MESAYNPEIGGEQTTVHWETYLKLLTWSKLQQMIRGRKPVPYSGPHISFTTGFDVGIKKSFADFYLHISVHYT
jgi:hypothetical protein